MKVLFLSIWYPSPASPVMGTFVHEQATALRAAGVDVRVMMPTPLVPFPINLLKDSYGKLAALPKQGEHEGVAVRYPRYLALPRHMFFERVGDWLYQGIREQVAAMYRDWPFDIIHAHTTYPCGHAANRCRDELFPRVKVVHAIHGTCIRDAPGYNRACFQRVSESLESADATVFVSKEGLRRALEITQGNIARHSEYITNGVSSRKFSLDQADQRKIDALKDAHSDTWNLLYVGNLSEAKGIKDLLDAMRRLVVGGRSNLRLFLVGANLMGRSLDDYIEANGLAKVVQRVGPVPHEHIKLWMRFADAFILPSHAEGTPTVLFEALFVGLPAIFTAVGGVGDIVSDGREALLIPPRSPEAIEKAIASLMDNPELGHELATRGQQLIQGKYTWNINAAAHVGLYRRLIGSQAG